MTAIMDHVAESIASIRADNRSGSTAISRKAAEILLEIASLDSFRPVLEKTCLELANAQPAMASIVTLANNALWNGISPSALRTVCRQFIEGLDEHNERIAEHALSLLHDGDAVLTFSSSRTVLDSLLAAHKSGKSFKVLLTEGRPACEGSDAARELSSAGIPVTLQVDAGLLELVSQAGVVIIGADAVTPQNVVNKIGTSLLVSAARHLGRRCFVLCGSDKLLPAGYELPEEPPKPAREITEQADPNLTVVNRYFDSTPLDWITGFITEEGRLTSWRIRERLDHNEAHTILAS